MRFWAICVVSLTVASLPTAASARPWKWPRCITGTIEEAVGTDDHALGLTSDAATARIVHDLEARSDFHSSLAQAIYGSGVLEDELPTFFGDFRSRFSHEERLEVVRKWLYHLGSEAKEAVGERGPLVEEMLANRLDQSVEVWMKPVRKHYPKPAKGIHSAKVPAFNLVPVNSHQFVEAQLFPIPGETLRRAINEASRYQYRRFVSEHVDLFSPEQLEIILRYPRRAEFPESLLVRLEAKQRAWKTLHEVSDQKQSGILAMADLEHELTKLTQPTLGSLEFESLSKKCLQEAKSALSRSAGQDTEKRLYDQISSLVSGKLLSDDQIVQLLDRLAGTLVDPKLRSAAADGINRQMHDRWLREGTLERLRAEVGRQLYRPIPKKIWTPGYPSMTYLPSRDVLERTAAELRNFVSESSLKVQSLRRELIEDFENSAARKRLLPSESPLSTEIQATIATPQFHSGLGYLLQRIGVDRSDLPAFAREVAAWGPSQKAELIRLVLEASGARAPVREGFFLDASASLALDPKELASRLEDAFPKKKLGSWLPGRKTLPQTPHPSIHEVPAEELLTGGASAIDEAEFEQFRKTADPNELNRFCLRYFPLMTDGQLGFCMSLHRTGFEWVYKVVASHYRDRGHYRALIDQARNLRRARDNKLRLLGSASQEAQATEERYHHVMMSIMTEARGLIDQIEDCARLKFSPER